MSEVKHKYCEQLLNFAPQDEIDDYSKKNLSEALLEYNSRSKRILADTLFEINRTKYLSLLAALYEQENFEYLKIRFINPRLNESWEYNRPTISMVINRDGYGTIETVEYDATSSQPWKLDSEITEEKAMVRVYPLYYFYPESIRSVSLRGHMERKYPFKIELFLFEEFWKLVRSSGLIPFEIRICVYTQNAKLNYDINLINSSLLGDYRTGKMPITKRILKNPVIYYKVDKIISELNAPAFVKRITDLIIESEFTTIWQIAETFNITETMASNYVNVLINKKLVTKEGRPPNEKYCFDFSSIGGDIPFTPNPKTVKKIAPKLDEKMLKYEGPKCPLCESPITENAILCEKCAADVAKGTQSYMEPKNNEHERKGMGNRNL